VVYTVLILVCGISLFIPRISLSKPVKVLCNSFLPCAIVDDKMPSHHLSKTLPNIAQLSHPTIRSQQQYFKIA
jgi:hypothetical protein